MNKELVDNRFKLIKMLGSGGQGEVFLAEDTADSNRKVALKKYRVTTRPGRADHWKRMVTEAQALQDLDSPNVVRLIASNLAPNHDTDITYIVTEYARFGTLKDHDYFKGEIELALRLFRLICQGVQAIHVKDIIHRDLKPSNILLVESEKDPRVGDFGICLLGADEDEGRATKIREKVGPMFFTAPEQTSLPPTFSKRADIYSLGWILYCMVTGDHGGAPGDDYVPVSVQLGMQKPHRIDAFIQRMTKFDPNGRPGTIVEVIDEINKLLGVSTNEATRRTFTKMQRRILKFIGSERGASADLEDIMDYLACFLNIDRGPSLLRIPGLTGGISWEKFADRVEASLDQLEAAGILDHSRGSYSILNLPDDEDE